MSYLTPTDYEAVVKADNLTALLDGSTTALATAEAEAVSMARTYLYDLYDVDTVFAQVGEARHPHLVRIVRTIVLYLLYQRLPKRMVPETVQADYGDAVTFLEKVADAKIGMELPRRMKSDPTTTKPVTRFRWGSRPRQVPD